MNGVERFGGGGDRWVDWVEGRKGQKRIEGVGGRG